MYALSSHSSAWKEIGVECPGRTLISDLCQKLEKIKLKPFYHWVTHKKKVVRKVQEEPTGEEAVMLLSGMVDGSKGRIHEYNIYSQFSEL